MIKESVSQRMLRGRWVLPIAQPPLEYGVLHLDGANITAVYSAAEFAGLGYDGAVEEFPEAIILPGLINLHTHLDYTHMRLFDTTSPFFEWIRGLMNQSRNWSVEDFRASAMSGADEIAASGTTTVFDSSYTGMAAYALGERGLRGVVGLELFGVDSRNEQQVWDRWMDRRQALLQDWSQSHSATQFGGIAQALASGRVRVTAAPHAPYTVSPGLIRRAKQWATEQALPWTIHLSETEHERSWINSGDQVVDDFLLSVPGVVPDGRLDSLVWRNCGHNPITFMATESLLDENLVAAHCVRLDADDISKLASHKVKVGHCPRSNARLRTGVAPISDLLEAGVEFGFGTDSAASTDNLDVLSEARFAVNLHRALHPTLPFGADSAIYRLTAGAAKSLGMSDSVGTLEPGKLADVAIFNVASCGENVWKLPYDTLLHGTVELRQLLVGGLKVLDKVVDKVL